MCRGTRPWESHNQEQTTGGTSAAMASLSSEMPEASAPAAEDLPSAMHCLNTTLGEAKN
jgi:hypothetical protein